MQFGISLKQKLSYETKTTESMKVNLDCELHII